MYNRYIPQPDGSYRRNRVQEPGRTPSMPSPPVQPPHQEEHPSQEQMPCPPQKDEAQKPDKHPPCRRESGPDSFLRQLLPKDFDTGDLIVVLLLLLMAGDCEADRNNAILTIALYFMM